MVFPGRRMVEVWERVATPGPAVMEETMEETEVSPFEKPLSAQSTL